MVVRADVLSGRVARLPSVVGWDPFADLAVPPRQRRERAQSVAEAFRAAAYRAEGVRAGLLLAMEISIQTSGFAVVLVGHLMQFGATVFRCRECVSMPVS